MVKIFVGRLAPCVSALQLRQLFEKFGSVSDCDILRDYGFVHMPQETEAQKAIKALDKYNFCGSRLSVELSTSRSMKSCQLIVKNLPRNISHDDLHKLFKKFGTVTLCKMNGESAVVHMRFPSMATNAVRCLSGETILGNVLSVEFATNTNHSEQQEQLCSAMPNRTSTSFQTNTDSMKSPTLDPTSNSSSLFHSSATTNQPSAKPLLGSNLSAPKQDVVLNPREKRQLRIRQGLAFLKSSVPWNGTVDLYKTFLNQLKEMLLEEGLDLFREGFPEKSVAQISDAININCYMKTEGIEGFSEMQDRLLLERAVIKLHMGRLEEALQDTEEGWRLTSCHVNLLLVRSHQAEMVIVKRHTKGCNYVIRVQVEPGSCDQALELTRGANQAIVRLKARLLAQCGRWSDAYAFMVQYHQLHNLDDESMRLLNTLKQNALWRSEGCLSLTSANKNGIIGDGRSRTPSLGCASSIDVNICLTQKQKSVAHPFTNVNGFTSSSLFSTGLPSPKTTSNADLTRSSCSTLTTCTTRSTQTSDQLMLHERNAPGSYTDVTTPSYTHFPSNSSTGGYTGSFFGPAMLGIASSVQYSPVPPSTNHSGLSSS